jgi:hypothetical protein
MLNPILGACALATQSAGSGTIVVEAEEVNGDPSSTPTLKLRLKKKEEDKKTVAWTTETVSSLAFKVTISLRLSFVTEWHNIAKM